jgi:hypothetical protein
MAAERPDGNEILRPDGALSFQAELFRFKGERRHGSTDLRQDLRSNVAQNMSTGTFSPQLHGNGYRRIIVAARNVSSGINHHHERPTNGEWSQTAHVRFNDAHSNGKDEEERPDEFNNVFIHSKTWFESCPPHSPARRGRRYPNWASAIVVRRACACFERPVRTIET